MEGESDGQRCRSRGESVREKQTPRPRHTEKLKEKQSWSPRERWGWGESARGPRGGEPQGRRGCGLSLWGHGNVWN